MENATTGEVVAFVFGRRTHATFRRLLALLPEAGWAVARWLTDAWGAYAACLPAAQHQVGKQAHAAIGAETLDPAHPPETSRPANDLFLQKTVLS